MKARQLGKMHKTLADSGGNVDDAFKAFHGADDYKKLQGLTTKKGKFRAAQDAYEQKLKAFDAMSPGARGSKTRADIKMDPAVSGLTSAEQAWMRSAGGTMDDLKRLQRLRGSGAQGFDRTLEYAKEFAPDVLKQVGMGGLAGGAAGAAAQTGSRALVRNKLKGLGQAAVPLGVAGVGGAALGYGLSS